MDIGKDCKYNIIYLIIGCDMVVLGMMLSIITFFGVWYVSEMPTYVEKEVQDTTATIQLDERVYDEKSVPSVCYQEECIVVEIANSPAERAKGLMFREYLPQSAGMLFIFDTEDIYPFRMKNTLIPLDMIWIDAHYRVVDIQQAPPCYTDSCPSYVPRAPAQYVLEVNSGVSAQWRIGIGTQLGFSINQ